MREEIDTTKSQEKAASAGQEEVKARSKQEDSKDAEGKIVGKRVQQFNAQGLVEKVVDSDIEGKVTTTREFTYNPRGQVVKETLLYESGSLFVTENSYDARGRQTKGAETHLVQGEKRGERIEKWDRTERKLPDGGSSEHELYTQMEVAYVDGKKTPGSKETRQNDRYMDKNGLPTQTLDISKREMAGVESSVVSKMQYRDGQMAKSEVTSSEGGRPLHAISREYDHLGKKGEVRVEETSYEQGYVRKARIEDSFGRLIKQE